jgi:LL-diaminopimelate aminotransferase
MPQPSTRLGMLPPYLSADLNRKANALRAKGVDVISFAMGDPDLPTPEPVVKELQRAAADGTNHNYAPCNGLPSYRQAVSQWLKKRFDVTVDPDTEVISLIGSKEGLAHMILAYVDPGDVVIVPSPAYPVYYNYAVITGAEPYTIPLKPENNFLPDLKAIPADIARRAKLMFLNYPNNPTGAVAPMSFVEEAIAFCRKHDILLCHDNAYSEMTFDGYQAPAFLQVPGAKDVCVELFSLSKMYNMTGWRIGFAAGNKKGLEALLQVKNNTDTGIFKPIQHAGITALSRSAELTEPISKIYAKRRDILHRGLQELGWDFAPNVATFYVWVPVPPGWDSDGFANLLLDECGIVVPPGTGYGPEGEGFFRMALTVAEDRLKEALARMKAKNIRYDSPAKAARA